MYGVRKTRMEGVRKMRRARCTWKTVESCKMYDFQVNNYEEVRITMFGESFRTFHGQNAHSDAKSYWNMIKELNA